MHAWKRVSIALVATGALATGGLIVANTANQSAAEATPAQAVAPVEITSAAQVLDAINAFREENGVAALKQAPLLDEAATTWATTIGSTAEPTNNPELEAQIPAEATEFGQTSGWGQPNLSYMVQTWQFLDDNRAELLNPAYTNVGIGIATGGSQFDLAASLIFVAIPEGEEAAVELPVADPGEQDAGEGEEQSPETEADPADTGSAVQGSTESEPEE